MRTQIIERIESEKIIAIVRLAQQSKTEAVLDTLISSGIKILEITSNTPGYCDEIRRAREKYPDILIGAGTITNAKLAGEAVSSGAQFIVTPNTNTDVISIAHEAELPVLMGAMTPTEISIAKDDGADFIKLFPAGTLGVEYFKAILGPFNNLRFLAVGGIDLTNAASWFQAGVSGVGIGGSLTRANPEEIKALISELLQLPKK